jgi:hypothetical protein
MREFYHSGYYYVIDLTFKTLDWKFFQLTEITTSPLYFSSLSSHLRRQSVKATFVTLREDKF